MDTASSGDDSFIIPIDFHKPRLLDGFVLSSKYRIKEVLTSPTKQDQSSVRDYLMVGHSLYPPDLPTFATL